MTNICKKCAISQCKIGEPWRAISVVSLPILANILRHTNASAVMHSTPFLHIHPSILPATGTRMELGTPLLAPFHGHPSSFHPSPLSGNICGGGGRAAAKNNSFYALGPTDWPTSQFPFRRLALGLLLSLLLLFLSSFNWAIHPKKRRNEFLVGQQRRVKNNPINLEGHKFVELLIWESRRAFLRWQKFFRKLELPKFCIVIL